MRAIILFIFCYIVFTSPNVIAAKIPVGSALDCNLQNVKLTSVKKSDGTDGELLLNSYNSTDCAGFYGNDDGNGFQPLNNFGAFGDGLLNGDNIYFQDGAFISMDDLMDLDGIGGVDDPGWIQLASLEGGLADVDTKYNKIKVPSTGDELDISSVLSLSFDCAVSADGCKAGTWSLATDLSIIEDVQNVLGRSTFDHLAISLKVGNRFVVYDFDFVDIFSKEPVGTFNFLTPYTLGGTFDTGDFANKNDKPQGISHINVWARDPVISDIPEPSGVLLLIMTCLLIRANSKNRN